MRNLLRSLRKAETAAGISPTLLKSARPRKPRINHGKSVSTLTRSPSTATFMRHFSRTLMTEKINTVGMMDSVRVSLTMVAKSPAASLKA